MEENSKAKNTLHVYCPSSIKRKLQELAESDRRSMSSQVQALIEEAHAKRFGTKPKLI